MPYGHFIRESLRGLFLDAEIERLELERRYPVETVVPALPEGPDRRRMEEAIALFRSNEADRAAADGAALAALNEAWGTRFTSFHFVPLPLALADYAPVRYTPGELRWSMATESYRRVWEHLAGRGWAIGGAVILALSALVCALKVKPILALIALNTFLLGYGGLMWAFALRPDRGPGAPAAGVNDTGVGGPAGDCLLAATVLAALPALIVFLLANRAVVKRLVIPATKQRAGANDE